MNTQDDGGGGGLSAATWVLVTPEEIETYREREGLSPFRLAVERFRVNLPTLEGWLSGKEVPNLAQQQRVRGVLDGSLREPGWLAGDGEGAPTRGGLVRTTGTIVSAYLESRGKSISPEDLVVLVREVRSALRGD